MHEALLEAVDGFAGVGIAGRDGAASAGIAAFKMNIADGEADGATLVGTEEAVFPECWNAGEFESGAEAKAEVVDGKATEPFVAKPFGFR